MRRIAIAVFVLLTGVLQAQQPSPQKSASDNAANNIIIAAPGESSVSITDSTGETWVLTKMADGNAYQGVVFGIELWLVTGRLTTDSFEFHAVNPNVDSPPGFCGSFAWSGSRTGGSISGTAFNEATAYNASVGCIFNANVTGNITVLIP